MQLWQTSPQAKQICQRF